MHVEMNRTSTCHHSSVSSVDNYPIRPARSRRIIASLTSRRTLVVDFSTATPKRTHERFLTSPRQVSHDDTRKHKNTLSGRSSVYAFGSRCHLQCVHFRQRGLRNLDMLSHEIVIVHVSRYDAHYDYRYLLRIHLLCLESMCDKRPQISSTCLC